MRMDTVNATDNEVSIEWFVAFSIDANTFDSG